LSVGCVDAVIGNDRSWSKISNVTVLQMDEVS